jgi:hypothetical protein
MPHPGPASGYFDPDEEGLLGIELELLLPELESDDELPGELAGGGGVVVVVGDADGEVLGRSLLRPDGDSVQALASVAMRANAHSPPSNLFMKPTS